MIFQHFSCKPPQSLIEKERNIILHIEEIHVKSTVAYKGRKIIGYSLQPEQPIKTVFAIMASSLYRKWSQIVRLLPCSSNSTEEVFAVVKSVISDIERCGVTVQVICIIHRAAFLI